MEYSVCRSPQYKVCITAHVTVTLQEASFDLGVARLALSLAQIAYMLYTTAF
jgi:hypothetical protein